MAVLFLSFFLWACLAGVGVGHSVDVVVVGNVYFISFMVGALLGFFVKGY